jgi:hypothetical protein
LAQNRKFQDFVETKYMADDAITNAETDASQAKHLRFLYDFDAVGGATGAITLTAMDGTVLSMPANAVIRNITYEVITAPTSSGSATIALGLLGNTDAFKAATAFNNAAFTAASHMHNEVPLKNGPAPLAVLATVAVAALTAGKFILHVEYYEGQA